MTGVIMIVAVMALALSFLTLVGMCGVAMRLNAIDGAAAKVFSIILERLDRADGAIATHSRRIDDGIIAAHARVITTH